MSEVQPGVRVPQPDHAEARCNGGYRWLRYLLTKCGTRLNCRLGETRPGPLDNCRLLLLVVIDLMLHHTYIIKWCFILIPYCKT